MPRVLRDRIGFQPSRNTIACLQFDHAQPFESTTDSRYSCTVNLTGNTVKYDSSALCVNTARRSRLVYAFALKGLCFSAHRQVACEMFPLL